MTKNIIISGSITCKPRDLDLITTYVEAHVRLTRDEPGCIHFNITQGNEDPCHFEIDERFIDRAAFDAHGERTRASEWWAKTKHIPRDIDIREES